MLTDILCAVLLVGSLLAFFASLMGPN